MQGVHQSTVVGRFTVVLASFNNRWFHSTLRERGITNDDNDRSVPDLRKDFSVVPTAVQWVRQ